MSFRSALDEASAVTHARLVESIRARVPKPLVEPMLHAVVGGKGMRGFLVQQSAGLYGIEPERSSLAAAAIEALHAYSLVHDDMPCMDNDDQRRGRPTVHVKWDEATAVLTGDALQSLAFELLSSRLLGSAAIRLELIQTLAIAAGAQGMAGGQMLDLAAEAAETPLTLEEITELQHAKTGALIEWSCIAGPILAGAEPEPMRQYARPLGLAFQIADDVIDTEGDAELAGKRLRKDAAAGKATFVSLLGLEGAKARAKDLVDEAEAALAPFGAKAEILRQAARFAISRRS